MLATQVSYWTLQETKRHDLATEDLGNRTLNENVRHNIVVENETQRHNIEQENYWNNSLSETSRHNQVTEAISGKELDISSMNAFSNQRNAATNEMNARTNATNAETNRFGTWANYNLGLDANRIAQQNADIRELEERDRWLAMVTGDKQAATGSRNADTNALNATTNARQADVSEGTLNLNQDKFQWQQKVDIADKAIDVGHLVNDVLSNILKYVDD